MLPAFPAHFVHWISLFELTLSVKRKTCFVVQGDMSFEEVSVYFSKEEWSQLDADQKVLHREVMLENSRNLSSLGKNHYLCSET
uniref:KRAB domain-containing protein n=1 Tax=Laticauda laticaudata TaxID=8630 RepID=A0A8C5T2R1_LATLA